MLTFLTLISLVILAKAAPRATPSRRDTCTISSLDDVDNAVQQCTNVNINGFTVPGGQALKLELQQGTTVNILGDITFEYNEWEGPLVEVKGQNITFNGNLKCWNGNGASYWDGEGNSGGTTKPHPMMHFDVTGALNDVYILNSPAEAVSVNSDSGVTVSGFKIDDSDGLYPNDRSNGLVAGRNTDGFDLHGSNIVVKDCTVINQDDCVAIKSGSNIQFENNLCQCGHGISIGSIVSNTNIQNVMIQGNQVTDSKQAFRIKTDKSATNSVVSGITFSDNTATNCTDYGVIIDQRYPSESGEPGNGVTISDIRFTSGTTNVDVASSAKQLSVFCGDGSCLDWQFDSLKLNGGQTGDSINSPVSVGSYGP